MKKTVLLVVVLFLAYLLVGVPVVWAAVPPTFPSCLNPQGTTIASYSDGTHGIVGSTATYTGKDTVYALNGNNSLTQCFCADNGQGIQTNWWKVADLSNSDVQNLVSQGWLYVPNGALWGLDNSPYLAQNSNFACLGGIGGGEETSSIQGVLGLASTGDPLTLNLLVFLGLGSLFLGFLLIKKTSR